MGAGFDFPIQLADACNQIEIIVASVEMENDKSYLHSPIVSYTAVSLASSPLWAV